MTCFLIVKMSNISKHVFLEYGEYQRLLEAKRKNELLLLKVRELEQTVSRLKNMPGNQSGSGSAQTNLSGVIASNDNALETPLPGLLNSITFPPSATLSESAVESRKEKKWYFLGIP